MNIFRLLCGVICFVAVAQPINAAASQSKGSTVVYCDYKKINVAKSSSIEAQEELRRVMIMFPVSDLNSVREVAKDVKVYDPSNLLLAPVVKSPKVVKLKSGEKVISLFAELVGSKFVSLGLFKSQRQNRLGQWDSAVSLSGGTQEDALNYIYLGQCSIESSPEARARFEALALPSTNIFKKTIP
jgi:hypothetical protein